MMIEWNKPIRQDMMSSLGERPQERERKTLTATSTVDLALHADDMQLDTWTNGPAIGPMFGGGCAERAVGMHGRPCLTV
jgi:hypothetical protein